MEKKKRKFTTEFKEAAVKLVKEEGYRQAEAAKNLGIDSRNLSRWLQESAETLSSKKGKTAVEE